MKRIIELRIEIDDSTEDTIEGKSIATQLVDDLQDIGMTAKVTVTNEYEE